MTGPPLETLIIRAKEQKTCLGLCQQHGSKGHPHTCCVLRCSANLPAAACRQLDNAKKVKHCQQTAWRTDGIDNHSCLCQMWVCLQSCWLQGSMHCVNISRLPLLAFMVTADLILSQKRGEMPENFRGQPPTGCGSELRDTTPLCSLMKLLPAGCACTSFFTAVPSASSL